MSKLDTAELRNKLLEIKGIGPETADSILLYAFQRPKFVIDAYTKRIMSRIGVCGSETGYEELQKTFESEISQNYLIFNEYHALIVLLAKENCNKTPKCDSCPLSNICARKEL